MQYVITLPYIIIPMTAAWMLFRWALTPAAARMVGWAPYACYLLVTLAAYLAPHLLILHIVLFFVPMLCARTREMVPALTLLGTLAAPSLTTSVEIGSLYLLDWPTHFTLALGGMAALAAKPGTGTARGGFNWPAAILLLLVIVITGRGTSATSWLRVTLSQVLAIGVPILVLGAVFRMRGAAERMFLTLGFTGMALSLIANLERLAGWPFYTFLWRKYGLPLEGTLFKYRGGSLRTFASLGESTAFGFTLVICLLAVLVMHRHYRKRGLWFIMPPVFLFGLLAPQSRGALLGAAIGVAALAWYKTGSRGLLRALVLSAPLGLLYVLSFLSTDPASRSADLDSTVDYRQRLFDRGLEEVQKSPLFGRPQAVVIRSMQDMVQGEGIVDFVNSYLYFGLMTGLVGLSLFCLSLALPTLKLAIVRRRVRGDPAQEQAAAFAFAALVSISGMVAATWLAPRLAILMLLATGAVVSMDARRRTGAHAPVPPLRPRAPSTRVHRRPQAAPS